MVHDNYIKYALNLPKNCGNQLSRSEIETFPLCLKICSQMVKYFLRLSQKTKNEIVDDAFDCAILINSPWIQTITRLLKSNGFADAISNPSSVNRETFAKQLLQRCNDIYLQSLMYSELNGINDYLSFKDNSDIDISQIYLDKVRIVEHRTTLTRLRTGCTRLAQDTGRYEIYLGKTVSVHYANKDLKT